MPGPNGKLEALGDHDWFAVTLVANKSYLVKVSGRTQYGQVSIGNAAGLADDVAISGYNYPGPTQDVFVHFTPTASGTYTSMSATMRRRKPTTSAPLSSPMTILTIPPGRARSRLGLLLHGGAGDDTLSGGAGDDTFYGRAGKDTLIGDDGDDVLLGGAGADVHNGGAGIDRAQYNDFPIGLTIDLQAPANNTGIAAGDSYIAVENLYGSNFDDNLRGNGAANTIWGGIGNDTLKGGADNDVLSGGPGSDNFVYDGGGNGIDISPISAERPRLEVVPVRGTSSSSSICCTAISNTAVPAVFSQTAIVRRGYKAARCRSIPTATARPIS